MVQCLIPYPELFENWEGTKFKKNLDNIVTEAMHAHHCPKRHAVERSCYVDGHMGFCAVWMKRRGQWERCGQRFSIQSDGCGIHTRKHEFNNAFAKAFGTGIPADISEFNERDPRWVTEDGPGMPVAAKDEKATEELQKADEDIEAAIAGGEFDPSLAYRTFQMLETQAKWAAQERRKANACRLASTRQALGQKGEKETVGKKTKNSKKKR